MAAVAQDVFLVHLARTDRFARLQATWDAAKLGLRKGGAHWDNPLTTVQYICIRRGYTREPSGRFGSLGASLVLMNGQKGKRLFLGRVCTARADCIAVGVMFAFNDACEWLSRHMEDLTV